MSDAASRVIAEATVSAAIDEARIAGRAWAARPVTARLAVISAVRRLLARSAEAVAATKSNRPIAETLVAEVLPLLEAARFIERDAARLLAPRRLSGGRPIWLLGVRAEVFREPAGVILVLAPSNYPLFLPGVQILQALAAGNAVCAKPAPGSEAPMDALATMLAEAGLPAGTLQVLPSGVEYGAAAVRAGFDHILLTGSAATGRRVLSDAALRLTPVTAELSGSDAVFVLPEADLALVAGCLAFGLRLNGSATCIAPRRVFATAGDAAALERLLLPMAEALPRTPVAEPVRTRLALLLAEASAAGGRVFGELEAEMRPVIVAGVLPPSRLLLEEMFAPVLSIIPVDDMDHALEIAGLCPYALGSSVFGAAAAARSFALRIRAGSVVVNDVIVPTADPRLAFGGRGASGFGTTRGAEGLLELTRIKTVSSRGGRLRPHLRPERKDDASNFALLIKMLHGSAWERSAALLRPVRNVLVRGRS